MSEALAAYAFFVSQQGFQVLPVEKFHNHTFILPSAISWEWKSVTALNILWIYLYSKVFTDTLHSIF